MEKIKHILVAANYRWPVYAEAFSRALEQIGVQVTRFDFQPFTSSLSGGLQIRCGYGPSLMRLNLALNYQLKKLRPDVCLIWNGLGVFPSTVKSIKKNCWVTGYTNDDPFGSRGRRLFWRHFKRSIPFYNSHHVYRDLNVAEYHKSGISNVELLRSYYVPWFHFRSNDRGEFNKEKIVFIGHGEEYRIKVITALANSGIPVEVYGPKETWSDLNQDSQNIKFFPGNLEPEKYRAVIENSAMCLGFLSRLNRDDYTRRYFEVPACGGFLLAERTPLVKKMFTEDQEMIFFSNPEEAIKKCKYYLSKREDRRKISEAAFNRCQNSGYDVVSRAKGWLKDIEQFNN